MGLSFPVTHLCVLPEDHMAILPVLTILEHLGAEITSVRNGEYEWIHVTYDHYTFTFDTSRADLGLEIPDRMESPE